MRVSMPAGRTHGWGIAGTYLTCEIPRLPHLNGITLHCIGGHDLRPMKQADWDLVNMGYCFFENDIETLRHTRRAAREWDFIIAGSSWCEHQLRIGGIKNTTTILQGIDPSLFYPMPTRKSDGRFIVYSGGKFEYRKGQDLVIAAMRIFMQRHTDVYLVCSWTNNWPFSLLSMQHSPHISFSPAREECSAILQRTIAENGIPPGRVCLVPLLDNTRMRDIYQQTDIGLFPNRCEGGNNMVMCEYMACNRTVIASDTTGHADVITDRNAFPLTTYTPVLIKDAQGNPSAIWHEAAVAELVEQLEFAYHNRDLCRQKGMVAAEDMTHLSWHKAAREFHAIGISLLQKPALISPRVVVPPEIPLPQKTSGSPLPSMAEAVAHHKRGEFAKAQTLYEQILKTDPGQSDALHLLGVIAGQKNDHRRALDLFNKAIKANPDNAAFHANRANALIALGQLDTAVNAFDQALALRPDDADTWYNRGVTLKKLEQPGTAIASLDKAIDLKPDFSEAYFIRGNALQDLQQLEAAVESYDRAIALKPTHSEAYSNRGFALQKLGQLKTAIANYDQAINLKPDHADAHYNRGIALAAIDQTDDALISFDRTIAIKLDRAEAYFHRGNAQEKLMQLTEAITSYNQAIAIKPDYHQAYSNRGVAHQKLKQLDASLDSYDKAIAIKPDYAEAHCNRGVILQELIRPVEAIISYNQAISLKPDYAEAYFNRSSALQDLRQTGAAVDGYDRAIAMKPDYVEAHWNKSLALLLLGDYGRGWELYEWRGKSDKFDIKLRNFTQPLWLGVESLEDKTILLHSEQGLGDTIQFCRYAKMVAAQGARVLLEVPGVLTGLLTGLAGVAEIITKGATLPHFDYHCPLLSLPLAFKTTLNTIPADPAYLSSDAANVAVWSDRLGTKTKTRVGIVWSGSTGHKNDRNRSLLLSDLIPHLPDGLEYVSLQKEVRDCDQATLQEHPAIRRFEEELVDFTDTAALCDLMDLVISVDTSVAHLSGALGKNTWVLLPYTPDWRWLLDRNDSPWYPSMHLYRQDTIGQWNNVLERITVALRGLTPASSTNKENAR